MLCVLKWYFVLTLRATLYVYEVLYCVYILFHSLFVVLFCVICLGNVNMCFLYQ